MARLIHVSNVSLDGYIEDERGSFEWTATSNEVSADAWNATETVS